jgi:hypothetical protein
MLACKRAAATARQFIVAHVHGMSLGIVTAVVLGALVFALRGLGAADYAILLVCGGAMALAGAAIVAWPRRWLIGAPAVGLALEVRTAALARLARFSVRAPRAKETSA